MNVVFSLRKAQKSKNGVALIYWYLSHQKQYSKRCSSGIRINEKYWRKRYATGSDGKVVNDALNRLRSDLTNLFNHHRDDISHIQEIADIYNKKFEKLTVVQLYDLLIARKVEEKWSKGTIDTYKSFRNVWLVPFCEEVGEPFYADSFKPKHLEKFASLMRKRCGTGFVRKSISSLKSAFNLGFSLEKIPKNYLGDYKLLHSKKEKEKEYVYLEIDELKRLENLVFTEKEKHLERDRDFFLLQCYTSLAYNELVNFDFSKNVQFEKEWNWIYIQRGKSDGLQQIPLLPQPMKILKKYDFIIDVNVNHRYNQNIRICAYRAKIDKYLHSHIGRTSCGGFLLNMGIELQTVSRVLGHRSIKITERYYAKIIDTWRVKDEFNRVFRNQ